MRAALASTMMATDLADYLVRKGATFREAHFTREDRIAQLAGETFHKDDVEADRGPLSALTRRSAWRSRRNYRPHHANQDFIPEPAPYR